jgi:hypothetical protein
MRQPLWRRWLMMSIFGAVPALGCNHAEHQCDCYSSRAVYIVPTPQPTIAVASAKPVSTVPVENHKVEQTLVTMAAKKTVPTPGTVAVPIVAGGDTGSKTGTLELTTADAEAMGVRPGYTPGALFVPQK